MNYLPGFAITTLLVAMTSYAVAADAELMPHLPEPNAVDAIETPTRLDELYFTRIAWGLETTLDQALLKSPGIIPAALAVCRESDACRPLVR